MWFPTITPQYDIQLLGRSLAGIFSVEITSSRRAEPDTAKVTLHWGTELERGEIKQGCPISIALGNTELGCQVLFDGLVESVSRNAQGAELTALDRSIYLDDTGFTQEWAEGTYIQDIIADLIAATGLRAGVSDLNQRQLPTDFYLEEQTVADAVAHLCGISGLDRWIVPGTDIMYVGPRWPYQHGLLIQENLWVLDLASNEIISHNLKHKEQSEYRAVRLVYVDGQFTGEEPVVGHAAFIDGEVVKGEAAAGVTPVKVIRQAGSSRDIDKADQEAYQHLLRLATAGYEGTIVTHLNPDILHSHQVHLKGGVLPESDYPIEQVVYRLGAGGSEMELTLAPLTDEGR